MFINTLIQRGLDLAGDKKIKDVRAGLGYTGVVLEDDSCGLAYTFRNEMGGGCGVFGAAGKLIGMDAKEIMPWLREKDRLRAAMGLATINALLNDPRKDWDTGNVLSAFELDSSETFGMVGEFPPIFHKVKQMTKNIYVFEQNVASESELYPSETIPDHLPKCDVVVMTATSLINHTFDEIFPYLKNAREVCLVGPSTPLCPELLREYNITLLAGTVVKDLKSAMEIISQGGGTMALKAATVQVLVRT